MQITLLAGAGIQAVKLFDASQHKGKKYGLMIQVVDAINVWISTTTSDLNNLDTSGNPAGGIELQGALSSVTFMQFADVIYARASAQGRINVVPYLREL